MRRKPNYSAKSKRSEHASDETAIVKDAPAPRRAPPSVPIEEKPPKSSRRKKKTDEPPPPLSTFALRFDGRLLLSLEDAQDRNLVGRQTQRFLVLTDAEHDDARDIADDGIAAAASSIIANLPKLRA